MREWAHELNHAVPLWMGIVNVTPDSFSDGGEHTDWPAIDRLTDELVSAGGHIIDVGAESTRPGATRAFARAGMGPGSVPWLEQLSQKWREDPLRPRLSIDTRHPQTAERALSMGVDLINDVERLVLARYAGAREGE